MNLIETSTLPNITGESVAGAQAELCDFLKPGRYTLIWWHPQALSPLACKTCSGGGSISEPVRLLMGIHEAGCDVVGLSYEPTDRLAKYLSDIGLEYPLLSVTSDAARQHGVAKVDGEPWQSIPRRIAFLVDEHAQVINRYEVHDVNAFLRTVRDDVKAGPPPSEWTPVKKRKKFLGIL